MTIEEIQTALAELVAAMVEKGIVKPNASARIMTGSRHSIHLQCSHERKAFDGKDYFFLYGETLPQCLDDASAYIAALPSPEEAVTHEYLGKVADAIDFGTKHSIDDKYVTPLRGVTKAMTDNLLTKEQAQ